MVAVANLAVAQKRGPGRRIDEKEKTEMKATIVRLQRAGTLELKSLDDEPEEEEGSRVKRLFQKLSFWKGEHSKEPDFVDDNMDKNNEKHAEAATRSRQATSKRAILDQTQPTQGAAEAADSTPQGQLASQASNLYQTNSLLICSNSLAEAQLANASTKSGEGSIETITALFATPNAEIAQEHFESKDGEEAD